MAVSTSLTISSNFPPTMRTTTTVIRHRPGLPLQVKKSPIVSGRAAVTTAMNVDCVLGVIFFSTEASILISTRDAKLQGFSKKKLRLQFGTSIRNNCMKLSCIFSGPRKRTIFPLFLTFIHSHSFLNRQIQGKKVIFQALERWWWEEKNEWVTFNKLNRIFERRGKNRCFSLFHLLTQFKKLTTNLIAPAKKSCLRPRYKKYSSSSSFSRPSCFATRQRN